MADDREAPGLPDGPDLPSAPAPLPPPQVPADPFPVKIWDLLVLAAFVVGLTLVLGGGAAYLWTLAQGKSAGGPSQSLVLIASALQAVVMAVGIYVLVMRRRGLSWHDIGFRPAERAWLIGAAFVPVFLIPAVSALTIGFQKLTGRPFKSPQIEILAPEGFTWHGAIGLVVIAGLLVPVLEEIIFRGLLYRWIRKHWGVWSSIIASSLIFGIAHMIPDTIPGTTLAGAVFAFLYEKSGSLWVPVITHVTFNTVQLVILFAVMAAGGLPVPP